MTLDVGILSAAHVHTSGYATELATRDDLTFVGVTDTDEERGRDVAETFDTEFVADGDALLERLDAAVICAPNADHREWIERAADADVDVLCEKPLAPTVEDARAIVERWRASDIAVGVAMPLRFSEPAKRAATVLDAGELGTIHAITGTNRGSMPGGWFVDPEAAGGGAVMDHTVHIVDLVYHLLGTAVSEVYAEVDTRFHDIAVDDVNLLSMTLEDGTAFSLDGSWSKPDTWHTWGDATVELLGEQGTLSVDCNGQSILHTVASGPDAGIHSVTHKSNTTAAMVEDFVTAIRAGDDPMTTPDDGLKAVAVVEAAYESARRGEPVPVEY